MLKLSHRSMITQGNHEDHKIKIIKQYNEKESQIEAFNSSHGWQKGDDHDIKVLIKEHN